MKYNYKVRIMSDENVKSEDQWVEIEVECAEAKQVVQIINKYFGFELVSRDSVYNYFNRKHLCSKKVFGGARNRALVELERSRVVSKRKALAAKRAATTEAQCSAVSSSA
jgi:hypothetical protein